MATDLCPAVLVSALIRPRGALGQILQLLRDEQFELIYAQSLLTEFLTVINRPRIREKYHIGQDDVSAVLALIVLRGRLVQPERRIRICRDPKDDKFLEVAIEGEAGVIISGDSDLLTLHPFQGVNIMSPLDFIKRYFPDELL